MDGPSIKQSGRLIQGRSSASSLVETGPVSSNFLCHHMSQLDPLIVVIQHQPILRLLAHADNAQCEMQNTII